MRADYPHGVFDGMDAWLDNFIPFHDTCAWTVHEITNHVVGEDSQGIWGTCYGWVRWTMKDKPGYINRAEVLFRDRLREDERDLADRPAQAADAVVPAAGAAPGRVHPAAVRPRPRRLDLGGVPWPVGTLARPNSAEGTADCRRYFFTTRVFGPDVDCRYGALAE